LSVVLICNRQTFARAWSGDSDRARIIRMDASAFCNPSDQTPTIRFEPRMYNISGGKTSMYRDRQKPATRRTRPIKLCTAWKNTAGAPRNYVRRNGRNREPLGDEQSCRRRQALRVCRCALELFLLGAARHSRRDGLPPRPRIKQRSPCPAPVMAVLPSILGRPIDSARRHGHGPWTLEFTVRTQRICSPSSRHCRRGVRQQ
jgi:hypothetical protein